MLERVRKNKEVLLVHSYALLTTRRYFQVFGMHVLVGVESDGVLAIIETTKMLKHNSKKVK